MSPAQVVPVRMSELIKYADEARARISLARNLAPPGGLVFGPYGWVDPSAGRRLTLDEDCAAILARHNQAARAAGIRDFDLTMEQLFAKNEEGKYVYS